MSFISSGNLSTATVLPLVSLINPEAGTTLTEAIGPKERKSSSKFLASNLIKRFNYVPVENMALHINTPMHR